MPEGFHDWRRADDIARLGRRRAWTRRAHQLDKLIVRTWKRNGSMKRKRSVPTRRSLDDLRLSRGKAPAGWTTCASRGDKAGKRPSMTPFSRLEAAKRAQVGFGGDPASVRRSIAAGPRWTDAAQAGRRSATRTSTCAKSRRQARQGPRRPAARRRKRRQLELDGARLEAEKRLKELEETRLQVEKLRLELTACGARPNQGRLAT